MKKKILLACSLSLVAVLLSGCICNGRETSFKEVDQKYANSAWTAFALYAPVIGWFFVAPALSLIKNDDYYKVLLKKPSTEAYEVLRWDGRFNFGYFPD